MNRILHCFAALICLALSAQATADVSVLIDTRSNSTEQFLVTVHTRHADLHNGYSRVRFQELVRANQRTRVPIKFYVSLVGHGLYAYHPDYLLESAVTERRGDELPTLFPRRWDAILDGAASLPFNGHGPTYVRALAHVEYYRDHFLPALDRAGIAPDGAVVPRLAALLAKADALTTFPVPAGDLARYDQDKLNARRARVLPDIEKLLASTRTRRLALVAFREATIGPKRIVEALLKEPDYGSLLAFIANVNAQNPASPLPQAQTWQNPVTGLQYTYRIDRWYPRQRGHEPPDCVRGQLTYDGRQIVEGAFDDLVKRIAVDFCRRPDGKWGIPE